MLSETAPVQMILFCPSCGLQHIDEATAAWDNPPHRSHLCLECGHIWRPADVPTEGVAWLNPLGKADSPPIRDRAGYAARAEGGAGAGLATGSDQPPVQQPRADLSHLDLTALEKRARECIKFSWVNVEERSAFSAETVLALLQHVHLVPELTRALRPFADRLRQLEAASGQPLRGNQRVFVSVNECRAAKRALSQAEQAAGLCVAPSNQAEEG